MPLSTAPVNGSISGLLEIAASSLIVATLTVSGLTQLLTGAQSSWHPFHQFITVEDVAAGRAEEAEERIKLALLAGKNPNAFESRVERPAEVAEATEFTPPPSHRDWRNIMLAVVGFVEALSRTAVLINTFTGAVGVRSVFVLLSPILLLVAWIYGSLLPITRPVSTTPYTLLFIDLASILSDFAVFYPATSVNFDSMSRSQQIGLVAHIIDFFLTGVCIAIAFSFPMHLNGKPEVDEEGLKPALDDYVNLWQWVTFSWMNPFISIGRKDTVEEHDVWQLSHLLSSRILMTKFRHFHRKSLLRRIVAANFLDLFLDFALSVVSSTLGILQPYILSLTLAALQADEVSIDSFPFHQVALAMPSAVYVLPSGIHFMIMAPIISNSPTQISFTPISKNRQLAYFYAIVAFVSQLVKTQSDLQHLYYSHRAEIRTYGELVGSIYEKALMRTDVMGVVASDLKGNGGKVTDDAQDDAVASADVGKVVSLVETDSQHCASVMTFMVYCYEAPINMIGSCILLQSLMGWTAFIGFFTFLLVLPVNYILMKTMFNLRKTLLDVRDKRMREMNQAIQAIKFIKFFAWEAKWMERIMDMRKREVFWLRKSKILGFFLTFLWDVVPLVVCIISFTFFVLIGHGKLTVAIAFPALQALSILTESLTMIPMLMQWLVTTYASYIRIDKYLNEEEVPNWVSWQSAVRTQEYDPHASFDDRVGFKDGFLRWASHDKEEVKAPKPSFISCFRSLFKCAHKTNGAPNARVDDINEEEQQPKDFELRGLNIIFKRGQLNLVCGPTGSGKSSLLSALLGEMKLTSGKVFLPKIPARIDPETGIHEDVSYCAQQPWLQHQSIRDNILFGLACDEERYQAVIKACALTTDLALLDDGDATEIGEKGVSLSGGQKARVALARAVYARSKTIILDDVLSAVDSHTAERLIHECLCGPLLAHRTIIMVTHHVDLIVDLAAWVVQLEDGLVTAQDTPENLRKQKLLSGIREKLKRRAELETAMSVPAANDDIGKDGLEMKNGSRNGTTRKLVEKEQKAEGHVKLRIYHIYLKASSYWLMSLEVFLFLLRACGEVSQRFWIRFWGESYYRDGTNPGFPRFPRPQDDVLPYLLGYIGLEVVTGTFSICASIPSIFSSLRASHRLYRTMLVSVLHAPSRWFDKTPSGRILNRFSKDIDTIDTGLQSYMTVVIESVLRLLLGILTILWGVLTFIAPMAVISGLMYWFTSGYISVSRDLQRIESNTRSLVIASFSELINGIPTVRAFGAERFFVNNVYTRLDRTQAADYYYSMCNRWLLFRFDSLGACITLTASLIAISTNISPGMVGIVISQAQTVIWGIYWLLRFYTEMEQALNSVERVSEYMDIPSEPPAILENNRPPAYWPSSTGGVTVENLVLKYSPELDPVLNNISFEVRPSEKIGVVGRTGSGKSTLALAFFRFVDPEQGKIVIDGIDITSIGLEDLRSRLTIIPQDAVLFSGTIRENLDPFNEHSDEDCLGALRRVQLRTSVSTSSVAVSSAVNTRSGTPSADGGPTESATATGESGVSTFVEGGTKTIITLDTKVSEGGNNFSSGQRQLIAMARALLRRSTFVVMDESTASVDFATDVRIQEAIREEFKDSILITIAHRLRTVIDYDRIMVIEAGQIAEFDSPKNLLKNGNGIFYSMCKKTGDFEELQAIAEKRTN